MIDDVKCPDCGTTFTRSLFASHTYCQKCDLNFHQEWPRKVAKLTGKRRNTLRCRLLGHKRRPRRVYGVKLDVCQRCYDAV